MRRFAVQALLVVMLPMGGLAQEAEPITAFGHGGFFGPDGKQIAVTMDFVTKAQAYYKAKLVNALPAAKKRDFATYQRRVMTGINATGQDRPGWAGNPIPVSKKGGRVGVGRSLRRRSEGLECVCAGT